MARSIHATRRQLRELRASDFASDEVREEREGALRTRLSRKRWIKRHARRDRRRRAQGITPIEHLRVDVRLDVRVDVRDTGPYVHHYASPDDVRAVLRRLPRGVVDGLARVELSAGIARQRELEPRFGFGDPDPWIGRLGSECLPGIWAGKILGTYWRGCATITQYAMVHHPGTPLAAELRAYLRLQALSTLVHEVAHHHDHTMRVARGRWYPWNGEIAEIYAERMQHAWLHAVVAPYLRETYPDEVCRFEAWVEHFGGVRLSLERIADDPRATRKGDRFSLALAVYSTDTMLEMLARDVVKRRPLATCRTLFARYLHYREWYDDAHRALDQALVEDPGNVEARTLRADIFVHERRWEEALASIDGVLADAPHDVTAILVAVDAHEGRKDWAAMRASAEQVLGLSDDSEYLWWRARERRVIAAAWLGDEATSRADLAALEARYDSDHRASWRARMRERVEEGLAASKTNPSACRVSAPAPGVRDGD